MKLKIVLRGWHAPVPLGVESANVGGVGGYADSLMKGRGLEHVF